jgi:hypothetical protein
MTRVNRLFEALDAALAGGWLSRFRKAEQAQRIAELWAMKLSAFTDAQFEAGLRKCESFDRAPSLGEVLALFGGAGQGSGSCAYVGEHGGCNRAGTISHGLTGGGPISHGLTGGGPWYCAEHFLGAASAKANETALVADTRRRYWRDNARLQRRIGEDEFVARGYDATLQETLGLRNNLRMPKPRAYQREPGEDAFEGEEAAP